MQFFSRNCTHILTRNQGKKFEYMFLVKIASKGPPYVCYINLIYPTYFNKHKIRPAQTDSIISPN